MKQYDAIVIGSGPAGITAALYLVRSGCSVALVEKLTAGGQVLQTEAIENYPGFPKGIKGWELADAFAAHLEGLPVDRFAEAVTAMKVVSTAPLQKGDASIAGGVIHRVRVGEQWLEGRSVVICSGSSHKKLGLPREDELTGRGISYCAICDGNFFRGQNVVVVGGGNTALEESLYLSKIVHKVHLVHRRDAFRGAKIYQSRLEAASDKVELVLSSVVSAIHGDNALTGVTVRQVQTGEERLIPVEGLFVFVGNKPSVDFVPQEVQQDGQGFLITDTEMRTSVPGIFAAGDIRSKLCRQVSTAVGDGATAAQAAFLYLEQFDA